jgi:hypothetical protein
MKTIKIEADPGSQFEQVAIEAQQSAELHNALAWFEFNGVKCFVNSQTNLEWLYRDYSNSWTMDWKQVGPNCLAVYEPEVQLEFEKRTKERNEKRATEEAEYRPKEQKQKLAFEESVNGIQLELSNPEGWKNSREKNSDPYGKAALDYAEGWAKLMQIEIAKGRTVRQCADYTQNGLGFLGITGFMYGCAVGILSQTWKHGEDLRKWHNKKYGHEGTGVVNPAVLTVSR